MKKILTSCRECRHKHRKCTRTEICGRCKRLGLKCIYDNSGYYKRGRPTKEHIAARILIRLSNPINFITELVQS